LTTLESRFGVEVAVIVTDNRVRTDPIVEGGEVQV
jgi:hypothetical protein